MSSLSRMYDAIQQFLLSFEVKIRAYILYLLSNLPEILHMGQFKGTDFESEPKHSIWILFECEECHFFPNSENFGQSLFNNKALPWQSHWLLSNENLFKNALYSYTKSQKVSLSYCKPFWHSKGKPAWIGLIFNHFFEYCAILVTRLTVKVRSLGIGTVFYLNWIENCAIPSERTLVRITRCMRYWDDLPLTQLLVVVLHMAVKGFFETYF